MSLAPLDLPSRQR